MIVHNSPAFRQPFKNERKSSMRLVVARFSFQRPYATAESEHEHPHLRATGIFFL
jgi:hypothetical protein